MSVRFKDVSQLFQWLDEIPLETHVKKTVTIERNLQYQEGTGKLVEPFWSIIVRCGSGEYSAKLVGYGNNPRGPSGGSLADKVEWALQALKKNDDEVSVTCKAAQKVKSE